MGHVISHGKEYQLLQQRLSQKVQGASNSPVLMKILSMLFSPEEAQIAGRLPHNFTPLDSLVDKFNIPKDELVFRFIKIFTFRRGRNQTFSTDELQGQS